MSHAHVRLEGGGGKSAKREPITSTIPGTVSFLKESAPKKKQKDGGVEITRNVAFDVLPENPSILPFDDAAHIVGCKCTSNLLPQREKKHNETERRHAARKHSHRIVVGTRISTNRRRLEATMRTYHCGKCGKRVPRHQRSWTVGRCDLPAVPRHQIRGGGGTIIIRSAASLTGQVRLMVKFKSYDVNILSTTATADGGQYDSRATSSAVPNGVGTLCVPTLHECSGDHWADATSLRRVSAQCHAIVETYDGGKRFAYPNKVRWESPKGMYLKTRPTYFAMEASERAVPMKNIGYCDFMFRRVDRPGVTIESVLNVAVLQAFWRSFPEGTPDKFTKRGAGTHALTTKAESEGFCSWYKKQPQATKHEIVWEAGQSGGVHPVQVMYESNDGVGALIQRAQSMAAEVRQMKKMAAETERTVAADEVIDKIKAENIEHLDEIAKTEVSRLLEALADPERELRFFGRARECSGT